MPPLLAVLAALIPATNGFDPETTFPNFFELLILLNIAGLTFILIGFAFYNTSAFEEEFILILLMTILELESDDLSLLLSKLLILFVCYFKLKIN